MAVVIGKVEPRNSTYKKHAWSISFISNAISYTNDLLNLSWANREFLADISWMCSGIELSPYKGLPSLISCFISSWSLATSAAFSDHPQKRTIRSTHESYWIDDVYVIVFLTAAVLIGVKETTKSTKESGDTKRDTKTTTNTNRVHALYTCAYNKLLLYEERIKQPYQSHKWRQELQRYQLPMQHNRKVESSVQHGWIWDRCR